MGAGPSDHNRLKPDLNKHKSNSRYLSFDALNDQNSLKSDSKNLKKIQKIFKFSVNDKQEIENVKKRDYSTTKNRKKNNFFTKSLTFVTSASNTNCSTNKQNEISNPGDSTFDSCSKSFKHTTSVESSSGCSSGASSSNLSISRRLNNCKQQSECLLKTNISPLMTCSSTHSVLSAVNFESTPSGAETNDLSYLNGLDKALAQSQPKRALNRNNDHLMDKSKSMFVENFTIEEKVNKKSKFKNRFSLKSNKLKKSEHKQGNERDSGIISDLFNLGSTSNLRVKLSNATESLRNSFSVFSLKSSLESKREDSSASYSCENLPSVKSESSKKKKKKKREILSHKCKEIDFKNYEFKTNNHNNTIARNDNFKEQSIDLALNTAFPTSLSSCASVYNKNNYNNGFSNHTSSLANHANYNSFSNNSSVESRPDSNQAHIILQLKNPQLQHNKSILKRRSSVSSAASSSYVSSTSDSHNSSSSSSSASSASSTSSQMSKLNNCAASLRRTTTFHSTQSNQSSSSFSSSNKNIAQSQAENYQHSNSQINQSLIETCQRQQKPKVLTNSHHSNQATHRHQKIVVQASTSDLLRCFASFLSKKCSHLINLDNKENDKLKADSRDIVNWMRSADRALLMQGWQEIAFMNPVNVVFVYLLVRDSLRPEELKCVYDLQCNIMACLYIAFSYMGNEISYPLKPFLIEDNRDLFWSRTVSLMSLLSANMLRINQEPRFFTELFYELKAYSTQTSPSVDTAIKTSSMQGLHKSITVNSINPNRNFNSAQMKIQKSNYDLVNKTQGLRLRNLDEVKPIDGDEKQHGLFMNVSRCSSHFENLSFNQQIQRSNLSTFSRPKAHCYNFLSKYEQTNTLPMSESLSYKPIAYCI